MARSSSGLVGARYPAPNSFLNILFPVHIMFRWPAPLISCWSLVVANFAFGDSHVATAARVRRRHASFTKQVRDRVRMVSYISRRANGGCRERGIATSSVKFLGLDDSRADTLLVSLGGRPTSAWTHPNIEASTHSDAISFHTCVSLPARCSHCIRAQSSWCLQSSGARPCCLHVRCCEDDAVKLKVNIEGQITWLSVQVVALLSWHRTLR